MDTLSQRSSSSGSSEDYMRPLNIHSLPTELMIYIVKLLPSQSVVSLSLINKATWKQLTGTIPYLRAKSRRKHEFLRLLDRDLSEHIHCWKCGILHKIALSQRAIGSISSRIIQAPCSAYYPVIQMIKKRHTQGLDYSAHTKYLVRLLDSSFRSENTACLSAAKIVDGSFYLRTQHWLRVSPTVMKQAKLKKGIPSEFVAFQNTVASFVTDLFSLCYGVRPDFNLIYLLQLAECESVYYESYAVLFETWIRTGLMTGVVFAEKMHKRGYAFVVTLWLNLGDYASPYGSVTRLGRCGLEDDICCSCLLSQAICFCSRYALRRLQETRTPYLVYEGERKFCRGWASSNKQWDDFYKTWSELSPEERGNWKTSCMGRKAVGVKDSLSSLFDLVRPIFIMSSALLRGRIDNS